MAISLLNIITRDEPIAGLEISDSFLRLALLRFDKEKGAATIAGLAEEPVPDGTIGNGDVIKSDQFSKALQNLLKKFPVKVRYAVISLPTNKAYTHVYSFPPTIHGEKLKESVELTVGFQLPVKTKDVYLDWEKIDGSERNEIFLAALSGTTVDKYVEILEKTGIKPIAAELHPLSLARVLEFPPDEPSVLLSVPGKDNVGVFVLEKKTLRFSRNIPRTVLAKTSLSAETQKIRNFYTAEGNALGPDAELKNTKILEVFADHPEIKKNESTWLISVGAALRGLLPRPNDTLVSLLPVGTEEAYEFQKAVSFIDFLGTATISLSLFFAAVFLGAWIFMTSAQQSTTARVETLTSLPLPQDAALLEERAQHLNALLKTTEGLTKTLPRWSPMLEDLKTKVGTGITISGVSFPSPEGPFALKGTAGNRTQLNILKRQIEASPYFQNVRLPLFALELKENIPFSISFELKDPTSLYRQPDLPSDVTP